MTENLYTLHSKIRYTTGLVECMKFDSKWSLPFVENQLINFTQNRKDHMKSMAFCWKKQLIDSLQNDKSRMGSKCYKCCTTCHFILDTARITQAVRLFMKLIGLDDILQIRLLIDTTNNLKISQFYHPLSSTYRFML